MKINFDWLKFKMNFEKMFYNFGRKVGASVQKGKWYYKSAFGSEEEAIKAERIVGRELALNMRQEFTIADDLHNQNFVDNVGEQLTKKVVDKNRKFNFHIISSTDINAFALPGGFIFITDGLLDKISNDRDEMAFVLAHEIMHVVSKHPLNRILSNYSMQIISNVIFKGGTFGAMTKQMLTTLINNTYSQDQESEADEWAVRLMYSAGFNPRGSKSLLIKLRKNTSTETSFLNYFLSHPAIENRIKNIDELIKKRKMEVE